MKMYLVRHTKPDIPTGICYGQSNLDVCESFEEERQRVERKLGQLPIGKIYSSPLLRCVRLAESFAGRYGHIRYDNRLKEMNFGDWEMKSWEKIMKLEVAGKWFKDFYNLAVPGGESFADLVERVREFYLEIASDPDQQDCLIICHGGVIRAMNIIINGTDPMKAFEDKIDFGQVKEFNLP